MIGQRIAIKIKIVCGVIYNIGFNNIICCNNTGEYQRKNKLKTIKKLNSNEKFEIDDNRKYSEKEINLILNDFIKQTIKAPEKLISSAFIYTL